MDKKEAFTKLSFTPDSKKEVYLKQHPELLDTELVDWAISSALSKDTSNKKRIGEAALFLASKMKDGKRQGIIRKILV